MTLAARLAAPFRSSHRRVSATGLKSRSPGAILYCIGMPQMEQHLITVIRQLLFHSPGSKKSQGTQGKQGKQGGWGGGVQARYQRGRGGRATRECDPGMWACCWIAPAGYRRP